MQVTLNSPLTPQTAQARSAKHYKLSFRSVVVHLAVQDGDTLESLSADSGFSKAKLQAANGGDPYLTAGQTLEFVIKVPENMMPVSKNRRCVLVPVEAAYSDDEQEVVVAQENRQVQQEEREEQQRLAQQGREQLLQQQMLMQAGPAMRANIVQTARFFGSALGNIVVAAGVISLLWALLTFRIERCTDSDTDTDTDTDTARAATAGSRLEDPKVRAEMERSSVSTHVNSIPPLSPQEHPSTSDSHQEPFPPGGTSQPSPQHGFAPASPQPHWADLEAVYFAVNEDGEPMNCLIPQDQGQQGDMQQCAMVFQNADDLAVLLGMIRAMTDQSLTGVGCYPLTLLQEAEQSERAVAFYRDGVIANANHIKDEVEWMEHVITLSEVLAPSDIPAILASRQVQLQEEKQKAQRASTAKAEAADTAASSTNSGSEVDLGAHADASVDSDADVDSVGVQRAGPASNRGGDDIAGGRDEGHHSEVHSKQSSRATNGASTNNSSHQPAQGDSVYEARANAYAGMHRKEVVRLSKDSLNQLDQTSRIPRQDALNPRDASPIPASVPGHHVSPNQDASNGGLSTSPDGGHSNGGYASVGEMKQNGLTMGMSSDLDALFAEAGIATDGSSSGSKQQEDIRRPAKDSWKKLSHVCVPFIDYRDGDSALITMKLGTSGNLSEHMLGFESRSDAEELRYLFQANMDEAEVMVHIVPMPPGQIAQMAAEQDLAVTVYAPGELQLKPGMTVDQLQEAAAEVFENLTCPSAYLNKGMGDKWNVLRLMLPTVFHLLPVTIGLLRSLMPLLRLLERRFMVIPSVRVHVHTPHVLCLGFEILSVPSIKLLARLSQQPQLMATAPIGLDDIIKGLVSHCFTTMFFAQLLGLLQITDSCIALLFEFTYLTLSAFVGIQQPEMTLDETSQVLWDDLQPVTDDLTELHGDVKLTANEVVDLRARECLEV
ncbi:MAG: hypothetical protein FRX49_03820 [Trebouxia sp. A1-2]|nr:MAG: hypothetical protein FRX49_03820 [Trebouxia sp. A1-2]